MLLANSWKSGNARGLSETGNGELLTNMSMSVIRSADGIYKESIGIMNHHMYITIIKHLYKHIP